MFFKVGALVEPINEQLIHLKDYMGWEFEIPLQIEGEVFAVKCVKYFYI